MPVAHLLTEDTLRFGTIRVLEDVGVSPAKMWIEWPMPELGRWKKLDLVVELDDCDRAAVEFKFPRDARGPISPDTMTLGELLSDFHRVAFLPVQHRWVVELLGDRFRRYLARLANRHPVVWPSSVGDQTTFTGVAIAGLPETARKAVGPWDREHDVVATCAAVVALPGQLTLLAFEVAGSSGVVPS